MWEVMNKMKNLRCADGGKSGEKLPATEYLLYAGLGLPFIPLCLGLGFEFRGNNYLARLCAAAVAFELAIIMTLFCSICIFNFFKSFWRIKWET